MKVSLPFRDAEGKSDSGGWLFGSRSGVGDFGLRFLALDRALQGA